MGYDISVSGEWDVDEKRERDAINAMLLACAKHDGCTHITDWMIQEEPLLDPEDRDSCLEYLDRRLERAGLDYSDDPGFSLHFDTGGYVRNVEEDEWLFKAVAPHVDASTSAIYFEGEDGYKWKWEVENGEFVEQEGKTVYGLEARAPEVLDKIIEVIYPDGKFDPDWGGDMLGALTLIERAIRLNGFGPQAGMTELDRLASV